MSTEKASCKTTEMKKYLQKVEKGVQDDRHNLGFFDDQEVTHRLQGASLDYGHSLLQVPARCEIRDGPNGLLLSLVLSLRGRGNSIKGWLLTSLHSLARSLTPCT